MIGTTRAEESCVFALPQGAPRDAVHQIRAWKGTVLGPPLLLLDISILICCPDMASSYSVVKGELRKKGYGANPDTLVQ